MFDFLSRQTRAKSTSSRYYALVLTAQALTSIATGVVIGYLLMFPVVYAFAAADAAKQPPVSGYHQWNASRNTSHRHRNVLEVGTRFLDAFAEPTEPDTRCVDPTTVFWFTSLFGISLSSFGILAATIYERRRIMQDGGWAIGLAVGGRRIESHPAAEERKLVNVVEELAIAFATKPPAIVVLDHEPGINVFAAGLTPADSILCVTHGALRHLPREELQGVIAHEFSHLTNGDTRLGTQLTAILYGLNSVRLIAESIFRIGRQTCDSNEEGSTAGYLWMFVAMVIWPFGLAGALAAAFLTLAITRSRETLADAEAVQKTRNPAALAKALRRIVGHPQRGQLLHPQTTIVAPMLFVDHHDTACWYATHPPIEKRLFALDPQGDATPIYSDVVTTPHHKDQAPKTLAAMKLLFADTTDFSPSAEPVTSSSLTSHATATHWGGGSVATLAQPAAAALSILHPQTFAISLPLLLALEPTGAVTECDPDWLEMIQQSDDATQTSWLTQIAQGVDGISASQREQLRSECQRCWDQLDDRDWTRRAWLWRIMRAIDPPPPPTTSTNVPLHDIAGCSRIILSVLSVCDGDDTMADYEFMRGWSQLRFADTSRLPEEALCWDDFEYAVQTMSHAPPPHIQALLVAIANVVSSDGRVSKAESAVIALVRGVLQ
ncbi:hypothetical protein Pla52o_20640 [Novipirellula galeiformis]|uniref:Peptidase M48 domain-containing protein n=1 Tax=Novipirellula galeiformis TaxID=2528004 RepID=A0A5C6CHK7_9BACT|nr:M48 family metalloprotease [Novipirellula galeiformis]TWU24140.1 hypothetical protein Pla52o_20640 [Novipirellula galeiformis]